MSKRFLFSHDLLTSETIEKKGRSTGNRGATYHLELDKLGPAFYDRGTIVVLEK